MMVTQSFESYAAVVLCSLTILDVVVDWTTKLGDDVDANQEIIALGTANLAAGLVRGFPMSASSSTPATSAR